MATSQDSSGISNPSSNFVQNLPPAPPRPPQQIQITPAQAIESLGHLEAQNELGFSPSKVSQPTNKTHLVRAANEAMVGYLANSDAVRTSIGNRVSAYEMAQLAAAAIAVPALEVGLQKLSENSVENERKRITAELEQRPGFLHDTELAHQAGTRHAENVAQALFDGTYDFEPSLKVRALKNVSQAYLSGSLPFLTSLDMPNAALASGAGTLMSEGHERHHQFAQADRLLEAMKSTCANDQHSMAAMSPEQQEAFSWGRSVVESRLMEHHTNVEVKAYIKEVYLDFLEEMDPVAMHDFMSRSQAVIQARKLFTSNLPESKFKKGIEKIKENLGLGTPPTHAKTQSLAPPAIKPLSR